MLANPAALQTALNPLLSALQTLSNALFTRDTALKIPGADGLTNSLIQMVQQQIALVQQRVQQAQDILADFAKIPGVIHPGSDCVPRPWPEVLGSLRRNCSDPAQGRHARRPVHRTQHRAGRLGRHSRR